MKQIKVLNVGQGDSVIISPNKLCKYSNCEIFIDLGDGRRNIFLEKQAEKKIIISLSHSHTDHIVGLIHFAKYFSDVEEIWLPYYFDEIIVMIDFLLKLKVE